MNHAGLVKLCRDSYHYVTFTIAECEVLLKYDEDDGHLYVVCRGTEVPKANPKNLWENFKNLWDVIRDVRIMPWHASDVGWCHAGFLKGGLGIAEFIVNYCPPNQPITLTGHSLGGSLSLVCAAKLKAQGYDVREWVGFGSPKLHFLSKRKFSFQQVNYRFKNDIVPLMPRIPGYRHNYPVIRLLSDQFNKGAATWEHHGVDCYVSAVRSLLASG